MTDELKPCPNPWCGSPRPPFLVWDLYRRHVQCDCGVRGPSSDHRSLDGVPHDVLEAEAIAAWNIRADPATTLDDPRVKALVEAAKGVEGRFYRAAKLFHNTQFWSDEEQDGQPLDDWVFAPILAALSALEENQ